MSGGERGQGGTGAGQHNAFLVKQPVPFVVAGRYVEGSAAV